MSLQTIHKIMMHIKHFTYDSNSKCNNKNLIKTFFLSTTSDKTLSKITKKNTILEDSITNKGNTKRRMFRV